MTRSYPVGAVAEASLAAGRLDEAEAAALDALECAVRFEERAWEGWAQWILGTSAEISARPRRSTSGRASPWPASSACGRSLSAASKAWLPSADAAMRLMYQVAMAASPLEIVEIPRYAPARTFPFLASALKRG